MSRLIRFSIVAVMLVMMFALARTSVSHAATEGTLNLWCDIRGAKPADEAFCYVAIDNVPQDTTIAPGKKVAYKLAPGDHQIAVSIGGPAPGAWSPEAGITKTVKISAGYTRSFYATFLRRGFIALALNQPNAVADFYVDGQLMQSQVASMQIYMTPAKWHAVEARNITDPTMTGDYRWKDAKINTYVGPGAVKTVRFNLQKQYDKGYLKLTCKITIKNGPANEPLFCLPTIDGVAVERIPQNGTVTYPLNPGSHTVVVTADPQHGIWVALQTSTLYPRITAGVTNQLTATPSIYMCDYAWTVGTVHSGCAAGPATTGHAVIEYFEHGIMLWHQAKGMYDILLDKRSAMGNVYEWTFDPLKPLRDTSGSVGTPPPGLYAPVNGFGIIWRGDLSVSPPSSVPDEIGWATTPEMGYEATTQCGYVHPTAPHDICYVTLPDGRIISKMTYTASWGFAQ